MFRTILRGGPFVVGICEGISERQVRGCLFGLACSLVINIIRRGDGNLGVARRSGGFVTSFCGCNFIKVVLR